MTLASVFNPFSASLILLYGVGSSFGLTWGLLLLTADFRWSHASGLAGGFCANFEANRGFQRIWSLLRRRASDGDEARGSIGEGM